MNNDSTLLNTLLQQAETAAQRHSQQSRLTKQAISRKLERTDSETVARELNAIYQNRTSRLAKPWRIAQQLAVYSEDKSW